MAINQKAKPFEPVGKPTCDECGQTIERGKQRHYKGRHFCSAQCVEACQAHASLTGG